MVLQNTFNWSICSHQKCITFVFAHFVGNKRCKQQWRMRVLLIMLFYYHCHGREKTAKLSKTGKRVQRDKFIAIFTTDVISTMFILLLTCHLLQQLSLRHLWTKPRQNYWKAITVFHWVTATLYWLVDTVHYWTIANLSGVGKSTVCSIVKHVYEVIGRIPLPKYMWPLMQKHSLWLNGWGRTAEVHVLSGWLWKPT